MKDEFLNKNGVIQNETKTTKARVLRLSQPRYW